MTSHLSRRLLSVVGSVALAVPLTVASVVPAGAALARPEARPPVVRTVDGYGVDPRRYGSPYGYGSYGAYGSYGGTATSSATTDTSVATAAESVGLVEVTSTLEYGEGVAAGTGMILRSNGTVVTNHHVVAGATAIKVTVVSTGRTYTARLIGADATHDVAVLKLVGAKGLTPIHTSTASVTTAEKVVAVGDANGDGGTLTAAPGAVIKPRRGITVTEDDGTTAKLAKLIEVSSDVIPGDSGGALLDSAGEVIGMNVAASSGSAATTGYVIPVARVLDVSGQILRGEASKTVAIGYDGFLGVELASTSTAPQVAGVLTGRAAAKAGIVDGDTLTSVDGTSVSSVSLLRRVVATLDPGDSVEVSWTDTSGATHSSTLTLGRAPVA